MGDCRLVACTAPARALLEFDGKQFEVCLRHANAYRQQGYKVVMPDQQEEETAE
jgi:hypothetical protein